MADYLPFRSVCLDVMGGRKVKVMDFAGRSFEGAGH